jgi:solute carrier family 25 oxoglutarate transporter 11
MGEKKPSAFKNFLLGGMAGIMATCVIQPVDYIKVQGQIASIGKKGVKPNPIAIAKQTIAEYGVFRLYTGLDAGIVRQATYTTTRMGVYKTLNDNYASKNPNPPSFFMRAAFSLTAGAIGAVIGNPADLALLRMQADASLPPEQKRNYTGVGNALTRIVSEEGVLTLWRGCMPTVCRAMALNLGMLGPYDQFKQIFTGLTGSPGTMVNIASSFCAASLACIFTIPFDNVKTKFQRMIPDANGKMPYSGFSDCFRQSVA